MGKEVLRLSQSTKDTDLITGFPKRLRDLGHFGAEEFRRIMDVAEIAAAAHKDELRHSGRPYLTHLIEAAEIYLQAGGRNPSVVKALLLHDIVENTAYFRPSGMTPQTFDQGLAEIRRKIKAKTDKTTAQIVIGLTKTINKVPKHDFEAQFIERLKSDPQIIIAKMCDRLSSLRDLQNVRDYKHHSSHLRKAVLFDPIFESVFTNPALTAPNRTIATNLLNDLRLNTGPINYGSVENTN